MRRSYSLAGLGTVLFLHALILYFVLLERPVQKKSVVTHYSDLIFIAVPPPKQAATEPRPPRIFILKIKPKNPVIPKVPDEVESSSPIEKPAPTSQADPFNESSRSNTGSLNTESLNIGNLVKQAGKADRETRPEREMRDYGPARDSMEAVMTKAFTAAKLAVPLKWYEAARIQELTPPGARKPIYQVKTAFGTYCLYYPDKLTEGTGQPEMADCPRPIGR